MILKSYEKLPDKFKTDAVKPYYDCLVRRRVSLVAKRILDIIFSLLFIIVFSPVYIAVALSVIINSGFPVLFRQERVTTYGRTFKVLKFRTMVNGADKSGTAVTVKNDMRITGIGKFLRKYRLDELPQIFNILKGDMSFVGTRPEVKHYVDAYTDEMYATLLLPAGVTSLASICYKDEAQLLEQSENADLTYINEILPDKMKYNLEYTRSFGIFTDISLIIKTVFAMLTQHDE